MLNTFSTLNVVSGSRSDMNVFCCIWEEDVLWLIKWNIKLPREAIQIKDFFNDQMKTDKRDDLI